MFGNASMKCTLLMFVQVIEINLSSMVPCVSGPKRPQDRVSVSSMKEDFQSCLDEKVTYKNAQSSDKYLSSGFCWCLEHYLTSTLFPAGWLQRLSHPEGEAGDPGSLPALWSGVSSGPRLGGHRCCHQLHQQLQPVCHADCRSESDDSCTLIPHSTA